MKKAFIFFILVFAVSSLQAQIDSIRYPVSLSSFEAALSNNTTKLKWKTECYITYANFQIQKSSNTVTFTTIIVLLQTGLDARSHLNLLIVPLLIQKLHITG